MTYVGVVGAGVMGTGVAHSLAAAGHDVVLVDVDDRALDRARARIALDCRMSRLTGGPDLDADKVLSRIEFGTGTRRLAEVEILVENIVEDWAAKSRLYTELDRVCAPGCVFVVNTSAIPITRIAGMTGRPDRVAGVHFMNPVPMKPAVEFIRGHHTSEETARRVRDLLGSMDKKAIDVSDACGFVSNRVLMLTVNEAAFLVHEGVASAEVVDTVFRECFGHPMGPLQTADLIGVDTILFSIEVIHDHFGDSKYRPCPLLRHMVDAGLHGRKSGEGFYKYGSAQAA